MICKIFINGEIGVDVTLVDVVRQYKSYGDEITSIEVDIKSNGGCVTTGNSIYDFLKNIELPIVTITNKAYSIASVIFMVGDIRLVEKDSTPLMIHLPWYESVSGDKNTLIHYTNELTIVEKKLTNFYSSHLNIDTQTITNLLENETWLTPEQSVDLGFATGYIQNSEFKAVAKYNDKKEEEIQMTKKEKFMKAVNSFFSDEVSEPKMLVIQDANGDEIDFSELNDESEITVKTEDNSGSMAVDGDNKNINGERVLPNGDTYCFEAGELVEIKLVETEEEVETEEVETEEEIDIEALLKVIESSIYAKLSAEFKSENEGLKTELTGLKSMLSSEQIEVSKKDITNKKTELPNGIQGIINLRNKNKK